MSRIAWIWSALLFVCVAGLTTYVIMHGLFPKSHLPHISVNQLNADVKNAHYTEYDENGQVHSDLKTPYAQNFSKIKLTRFVQPNLTIFTDEHIKWHITGDHGEALDGHRVLYIWGHVRLYQPPQPDHPPITITTTTLAYYPAISQAKTQAYVTLKRPGTLIHSQGMIANLKQGEVQLLSAPDADYNPALDPAHQEEKTHQATPSTSTDKN